jgi:hypothetical protein
MFHDRDHGEKGKIISKNKKIVAIYNKYSGKKSVYEIADENFVDFQEKILSDIVSVLEKIYTNMMNK